MKSLTLQDKKKTIICCEYYYGYLSVVAEQVRASNSNSDVSVVRQTVCSSPSRDTWTLKHCFVHPMIRKAVGPVRFVTHEKNPVHLPEKSRGSPSRRFHQTLPNLGIVLGLRTGSVPYPNT